MLRHGHSHGGSTAQRHPHAIGDASVALADGEASLHTGDDAGYGTALGALIALVPSLVAWLPHGARDVAASRLAWVPQTHHPEPFERPPRSV